MNEYQMKIIKSIGEKAIGKPMTHQMVTQLEQLVNIAVSSYTHDDRLDYVTLDYKDNEGNILYTTTYNDNLHYREALTANSIAQFVSTVEERIEEYIQNDFDRYYITELGSYVYQFIQDKTYDIAVTVVEEGKKQYYISDEDSVIDEVMKSIDFESLYDLVEDILNAPITMEEKLAEVGMSMKDFL